MQFSHHLRDFGNASAQQHIHFAARGLDIFEMHQFQARTQLADRVHRVITARREMPHIRGRANRVREP